MCRFRLPDDVSGLAHHDSVVGPWFMLTRDSIANHLTENSRGNDDTLPPPRPTLQPEHARGRCEMTGTLATDSALPHNMTVTRLVLVR